LELLDVSDTWILIALSLIIPTFLSIITLIVILLAKYNNLTIPWKTTITAAGTAMGILGVSDVALKLVDKEMRDNLLYLSYGLASLMYIAFLSYALIAGLIDSRARTIDSAQTVGTKWAVSRN